MMKHLFLNVLSFFLIINNVFSQVDDDRKWSIELGGSYGQLRSKVVYDETNLDTTIYRNDTKFRPMPVLRLTRSFKIKGAIQSTIQPFIGLSIIGTETNKPTTLLATNEPNVPFFINETEHLYYYLPSIEVGTFWSFPIKNFEIGLGVKSQSHLTLWTNDYFFDGEIISTNPLIIENENIFYTRKNLYHLISANFGGKIQYNFNRFLFGVEGWYGFTNLSKFEFEGVDYREKEVNLRLMIGYKL